MSRPVRVIKVGGSLFSFAALRPAMAQWFARQATATEIVIAGGGPLADVIREMDALHKFGEDEGHWLCVALMSVSARLVSRIVPDCRLMQSYDELHQLLAGDGTHRIVFAAESFLQNQEPRLPGQKCSRDWQTTSDAIAARLAQTVEADELVLLKSATLTADTSRREAARRGLVDKRFPEVAAAIPVRWVNLRDPDAVEKRLF